jgi:hypothetical protein
MKPPLTKTLIWLLLFSIAMGYLESSVVVYLREIYYPNGFSFPLTVMGDDIILTELFREVSTMIMLVGIAILAGRNAVQRFAFFLISFAIWDIFYYVFLYLLLCWPQSLLTWDILFLIPVPWVGPVLSPLIITFQMMLLAGLMVFFDSKGIKALISLKEWLLLISGSLIVIVSWTLDYGNYIISQYPNTSVWSLFSNKALLETTQNYVPQSFNWLLFILGVLFISVAISFYYMRNRSRK